MQKTLTRSEKEENFVRGWCQAFLDRYTTAEFANEHGLTFHQALHTFQRLRALGVKLPFLSGQNPKTDQVNYLQSIVDKALGAKK